MNERGPPYEEGASSSNSGVPTLITLTRANNISIMVSRLPGGPAELARAVASGNHEGTLSMERLGVLIQARSPWPVAAAGRSNFIVGFFNTLICSYSLTVNAHL